MKRFIFAAMIIVIVSAMMTSCQKAGLGNKISGKWYLSQYNGSSVDWGEYMEFSGSTLKWNSRLKGANTTYKITYSNNNVTIKAKCTYTSTGESLSGLDNEFTVTNYTSSSLTLIDKYGDVRQFSKK